MTTPAELAAPIGPVRAANAGWRHRKWGLIRLASPIVLVGLWQLASAVGLISQDVLPAPSLIVEASIEVVQNGQLADALRVSGIRVVEGLPLGGILGVALGTTVGLSRWFEATVAKSDQISSAPEFSRWVDRRYSDALAPLYINRD